MQNMARTLFETIRLGHYLGSSLEVLIGQLDRPKVKRGNVIWNKTNLKKIAVWFCRAVVIIGIAVAIDQLNLNIAVAAVVFIVFEGLVAFIDSRFSEK